MQLGHDVMSQPVMLLHDVTFCLTWVQSGETLVSGGSGIFLMGGANSQSGCANLCFAKYCMKMKEFGRGASTWRPLGSTNVS